MRLDYTKLSHSGKALMLHFNDPPNIEHRYNTSIMDKPKSPQPVVFHRVAINLATTMSWFVFWTTLPYVGLRLMAEAPVEPLALVALVLAGMRITWGAPWRRVTTMLVSAETMKRWVDDARNKKP